MDNVFQQFDEKYYNNQKLNNINKNSSRNIFEQLDDNYKNNTTNQKTQPLNNDTQQQPQQPRLASQIEVKQPQSQQQDDEGVISSLLGSVPEAGRSILQAGVNVANILPEVGNTLQSGGAWVGGKLGLSDGMYEPFFAKFQLPEVLAPHTEAGKIASEIAPYLIQIGGAEKAAMTLAEAANTGKLTKLADGVNHLIKGNILGALANSETGEDMPKNLAESMALAGAMGAGGKVIGKIASPLFKGAGSGIAKEGLKGELDTIGEKLAKTVDKPGKIDELASEIKPREDVITAAKNIGIEPEDLNLAHISGNKSYQVVEAALKSTPASELSASENELISNLSKKADHITKLTNASPYKVLMNENFTSAYRKTINDLSQKSNSIYEEITSKIPKNIKVDATETKKLLDERIDDLGGIKYLTPMEKRLYANLYTNDAPTFGRIDFNRKLVGSGMKRSGEFSNEQDYLLGSYYRTLTEDQGKVVSNYGYKDKWDLAKNLVSMRKETEQSAMDLIGKDLTGDITKKASVALMNLRKGETSGFRELYKIKDPELRQAVIGTSLKDVLSAGSRRENEFNLPGFVSWYDGVKKSGSAAILHKELGKKAAAKLENLFVVSKAVRDARDHDVATGILKEFNDKFNTNDGVLAKIYQHGKGSLVASILSSIPIVNKASNTLAIALSVANAINKPLRNVAADKLLSSPQFKYAILQAANRVPDGFEKQGVNRINKIISSSKFYGQFIESLPIKERKSLLRQGFVGWSLSKEKED